MSAITSSLAVDFSSVANSNGLRLALDQTIPVTKVNQAYVRVYGNAEKVVASSGSLYSVGSKIEQVTETVTFTNNTQVDLGVRPLGSVIIEKLGAFYNASGGASSCRVSYLPDRNCLVASAPCYGVARITYQEPYILYSFEFASISRLSYREACIFAINFTDHTSASLTLDPPGSGGAIYLPAYGVRPTIEVRPSSPVRLCRNGSWCRLNLAPWAVMPSLTASSGRLGAFGQKETVTVTVNAVFDRSSTFKLPYSMESLLYDTTPTIIPEFINQWGDPFPTRLNTGGTYVYDVDWTSKSSFTNPRRRQVASNELVVTDLLYNTVEAYGSVIIRYKITLQSCDFFFASVYDELGHFKEYAQSVLVAQHDGYMSALTLQGPSVLE